MKQVKGIVKKYSREYTRTLKSGKEKKYQTEQVQITIPKQEDIFNNNEEVLILPLTENALEDCFDTLTALEVNNYILQQENEQLKKLINNDEVQSYKRKISNLNFKNESMDNIEKNKNLINKFRNIDNFAYSNKPLFTEFQKAYIDLSKKYEKLQMELYSSRYNELSNAYLVKKLKDFILNED